MAAYNPHQGTFFEEFERQRLAPAKPPEPKPLPSCGATATTRGTSAAAAKDARGLASPMGRKVLEFIQSRGAAGATDEEIQIGLGMNPSTERPRRIELMRRDPPAIVESGTRPTRSGRHAAVWVAVEFCQ